MPAAAMTYTSLVEDIKAYSERGSDSAFVAQIPRFIMYAENRLATEVRVLGYQRYVNGTLSGNTLQKPSRWRETISLNLTVNGERVFLKERSYDYCRVYAPDPNVLGVPRYYANYDYEHFFIAPTPNQTYSFELAYYERPEPLSDSQQTSWTTEYAPQLLLYASLLEAAPFIKNADQVQQWQGFYQQALAQLMQEAARRQSARTESRSSE